MVKLSKTDSPEVKALKAHSRHLEQVIIKQRAELNKREAINIERNVMIADLIYILASKVNASEGEVRIAVLGIGENKYIAQLRAINSSLNELRAVIGAKSDLPHKELIREITMLVNNLKQAEANMRHVAEAAGEAYVDANCTIQAVEALKVKANHYKSESERRNCESDPQKVNLQMQLDLTKAQILGIENALRNLSDRILHVEYGPLKIGGQ